MPFLFISGSTAILVVLSHIRKRSRILPFLLFFMGILIIVCCNEGNDFRALQFRYDYLYFIEEFPLGFQWIIIRAKGAGLSFEGFKLVFGVFAFVFLFKFYNKYSIWPALCCALVFIFPCDSFYGQIRNGISAMIVIYAIMYYFNNDNKKKTLIYVGLILLAAIIHPSCIIYLGAILIHKNIQSNKIIGFSVIFIVMLIAGFYSGLIRNIAGMFIGDMRVLRWLNVGMFGNMFGSIASMIGHIAWIAYMAYSRKMAYPVFKNKTYGEKLLSKEVIDRIYNLNFISMTLIPLYFVTHAYFRIFKYLLFIDVLVVVQAAYVRKSNRQTLMIVSLVMFFSCYLISAMVGVGYRRIPVFYNSFDWSSLSRLFIR